MSSNLSKKNNEQKNYNFIYSPISINNKLKGQKKESSENYKSNEQLTKYYYQNISSQNKNHNLNSQSCKDKQKVTASPNNHFFYKSKILKETNINNVNQSKNFNETKNSEQNSRSPISLTGRITNMHNIKINKEKNDKEEKKNKGNNNIIDNKLIKSSNITSHNSKSVNNNNNKNKNIKYGNNLIIKMGNITDGLNNLRKENGNGNTKKNNYNFNNNNHGIIDNMNNNTSKNKKKNEISNTSNLNLGMLSFSTSNISVNNLVPVNSHNANNINNNKNDADNNLNNINIIKNQNITEEQNDNNNLNLCLDYISNSTNNTNKNSKLISKAEENKNKNNNNNNNIQTKSAEQTTRNPKYFKNESIYNTNYIINFIESNDVKNSKLGTSNKLDVSNKIYAIGQKEIKNNNLNNNAYKMLTDITKNNVNEILSKKNVQMKNKNENKKNSENSSTKGNNKYFNLNDGQKYKNPEELHFSMVKIIQNINRLKGKF